MRWYVSRAGETVGPVEEAEMRRLAASSGLDGALLRDEQGSAWMPAEKSPFKPLMKERGALGPAVAGLVVAALGLLLHPIFAAFGGVVTFLVLYGLRRR